MLDSRALIAPQFEETAARLSDLRWAASVGQALPQALTAFCAPIASLNEARAMLGSPEWEEWSLSNHNALTQYLDDRHHQRYQDWRAISGPVKDIYGQWEPAITQGLADAGLTDEVYRDAVRWDVAAALVCAGFADCRPPQDVVRLLDVYTAGHIPVGSTVNRYSSTDGRTGLRTGLVHHRGAPAGDSLAVARGPSTARGAGFLV